MNKVRRVIGAVAFLLPRVSPAVKRPTSRLRRTFLRVLFAVLAGAIIFSPTCYSSAFTEDDFTYTGTYSWINDGGSNFRLEFLSSGTFTPKKPIIIDASLIGGGGSGGNGLTYSGGAGGAGGYVNHQTSISLSANTGYPIVIGSGGTVGNNGNSTTGFSYTANGGAKGGSSTGGNGGSGGAGGSSSTVKTGGNGGSNGSNGTAGGGTAGYGAGTTTYDFGDSSLPLRAGGGGGGGYQTGGLGGAGGAGGGGNGGNPNVVGGNGTPNTGGGGGGGGGNNKAAGAGGSGILIIRNHR